MAFASLGSAALPDSVMNVSVFGSYGRGGFDESSDLDVLVVVKDGSGTTSEPAVAEAIRPLIPRRPSFSFYGERKLRAMFDEGHLFAWHLHFESYHIAGKATLKMMFGTPSAYRTSLKDVAGLTRILVNVEQQVRGAPHNSVFEMGILYVCARNIAMAASWRLNGRPDFGRYSPFTLCNVPFPTPKAQYDVMMHCRMASTRGETPVSVAPQVVIAAASAMVPWAASINELLRSG